MDELFSHGISNHEKGRTDKSETDGAPHLKIDTSVVSHNYHHEKGIPPPTATNIHNNSLLEAMQNKVRTDKNTTHSFHPHLHPRMRAMSESERLLFNSANGIRIPVKHPMRSFTQLTPPLSNSPGFFDTHNPYSTSAHIVDSPPENTNFSYPARRRNSKGLMLSSLDSNGQKPRSSEFLSPAEGVVSSLSCSYGAGAHSRQHTFVDASSYECVPDSPAKHWLQGFAQKTAPTPLPDDEGQEIGSYVIGRQIGVGGFSVVKEASTFQNGRQVQHAVKIVRKQASKDELGNEVLQSHFEHEINVWKCLSNRYILPLLSVLDTPYATWAFTLLFNGGTLFDVFKNYRQGLPPSLALKYSYQLASALRYLHQDARVVHRDVKLENCVLDRPASDGGNLRLCDFGLADFLPGDDTPSPRGQFVTPSSMIEDKHHLRSEDMVAGGSLAYAAPEQIKSITPLLDPAIDMWSYGVVVHALTVGELPFHDPFAPKLQMMILKGEWNVERCAARIDSEICEVITGCLKMNRDERWTAGDVLSSQWISLHYEDSFH